MPSTVIASWGAQSNLTVHGSTTVASFCSTTLVFLRLGTSECISATAIFDCLYKIAVRSNRLCILVSGLVDAFVTAFNLRRNSRGGDFKELMCGTLKMMTAQ